MVRADIPLLFAWDLGANWGHVVPLLALQPALEAQGFTIWAAVNDVRQHGARLAEAGIRVLQSPMSGVPSAQRLPTLSLAHIFANRGYTRSDHLIGLVEAWASLMLATRARLVLVDGSPAALMAARLLGLPVVNMSLPFHVPLVDQPFANFPADVVGKGKPPVAEVEQQLDAALLALRHTLQARAVAGYSVSALPLRFSDLFKVDEQGLFCWPELDPLGARPLQTYWGELTSGTRGQAFQWPAVEGPRIFAYLRPENPMARTLIRALGRLGWPVVLACPGWSALAEADREGLASDSLMIYEQSLDMQQACAETTFAVGNGGIGFTHAMLAAGRPLALLPTDAEKAMTCARVMAAGAGISLVHANEAAAMEHALRQFAANAEYFLRAQALARKHRPSADDDLAARVAQRCRQLVS